MLGSHLIINISRRDQNDTLVLARTACLMIIKGDIQRNVLGNGAFRNGLCHKYEYSYIAIGLQLFPYTIYTLAQKKRNFNVQIFYGDWTRISDPAS